MNMGGKNLIILNFQIYDHSSSHFQSLCYQLIIMDICINPQNMQIYLAHMMYIDICIYKMYTLKTILFFKT
jgi:hypothetical protein